MTSLPARMKAIEIKEPGGPEVLVPTTRPVPQVKTGEVLLRIVAAGVNRPDVLQRLGAYPPPEGASDLPGLEVSGVVIAVGEGVSTIAQGDSVCALLPGGGYAEYAVADAGACLPIPAGISMIEAASLPETVITVWANVYEDAGLTPGETLLVHGGTSGIGVTAISLAKATGARVFTTAGSSEKCDVARRVGADLALNYKDDDWQEAVKAAGGADVVLDMTGGDFLAKNLACLNPGGRHVSIAFLRGANATINIFDVMRKRLKISGSTLRARSPAQKAALVRAVQENVWPLVEKGDFKPFVNRTFPLEEASKAHELMEAGGHFGKIVLKLSAGTSVE